MYIFLQTLYFNDSFSPTVAILSLCDMKNVGMNGTKFCRKLHFLLLVYISFRSSISIWYNCRALVVGLPFHSLSFMAFFSLSSCFVFVKDFREKRANIRCVIFVKQWQNANLSVHYHVLSFFTHKSNS